MIVFRPVSSRVNFPQLEEDWLRFWREKRIFERSIDQRQGQPSFVLYDGPPTVNGSPALHHVLTSTFKDVIPRYKAMKGFYTPRTAGWDTHGLPVELEVEKQLGFSGKAQIEEYGVARFNAVCRENVNRYIKEFEQILERVAYWIDTQNAYVTMTSEYIESCWWAIKQMWDKGLIYQGYRVTPHCPRCGTSLSSHEVAQGYQDNVPDPSIYVKFKLVAQSPRGVTLDKPTYLLAWTTTPWTLPGNTALAVAADADYAVVEVGDEYFILAEARREAVGLSDKGVVRRLKGGDLVGVNYEPLFKPQDYGIAVKSFQPVKQVTPMLQEVAAPATYPVIATDFVSMEDGTGIVHVAPAYGEVDYEAGQAYGLHFVHTVDLQGKIIGIYPFAGEFVKDADKDILDDLKSRGLLFRSETIYHTYPFCWRCETPLLYYAKETWYIRTTALKDRLIVGNEEINWYPEHLKDGRFGDWLQNNVDWAFSRERYWGTPLPVWRCEGCGAYECVGSIGELKNKAGFSGFREPLDLHRPFVDEVTFACDKCHGRMERVPEVIDCWFDSGNMPIAQYHFPFETEKSVDDLARNGKFPADYICEAVDQTRGWFYSLHAISTLLFGRPSYKNVICLGHILDARGEKMSKRKGNVVWPWQIINKYGADPLRWYLIVASAPGNARRFDEKAVGETTRQFFLTLWNVYSFFVTYANIDRFIPRQEVVENTRNELDRWLISELNQLIADVDAALAGYDPTEAGRKIEEFVDRLSNWYVRRSRRRFWKSENDADKLSAYNTLYGCLVTLAKLIAPMAPYFAEELYQNLVCSTSTDAPESIHLTDFPAADESRIDRQLADDIHLAIKVSSLGRAARSQAGIKVRQPLAEAIVKVSAGQEREGLNRVMSQILDELNVKGLRIAENQVEMEKPGYVSCTDGSYSVAVPTSVSDALRAEGMAREIVHRLQTMRRSAGFDIADHIATYYQGDAYVRQIMQDKELSRYIAQETLSREIAEGIPQEGAFAERFKLEGREVLLGVKKMG